MTQPAQPPTQINIELPVDLEATYSNFAIINHSPSEIVIDFARLLPNVPKAKVHARIVMTPLNAKLLLRARCKITSPSTRSDSARYACRVRRVSRRRNGASGSSTDPVQLPSSI